ncbi:hypothetical protein H4Q26_009432 [Puccinia striiformis f. sp. tritici PST-130]|nr:hypothetical protein H4Q26_009432 [Puccinia striiformis f. sp. tritici PST-130]
MSHGICCSTNSVSFKSSICAGCQVMSFQQIKSDVIQNHLESELNSLLKIMIAEDSNQLITVEEIKSQLNIKDKQLQDLLKEEIEARS